MNTHNLQTNLLVSIEGIDGAGKSSLVAALSHVLQKNNLSVVTTKEPGGTSLGKSLRHLLLNSDETIAPLTQYLLFAADRSEHFQRIVIPALKSNKIVISDRMNDSSLAYQAYGNGLDQKMITQIDQWTMHTIKPDIVFYLKIDIQTALERIAHRGEQTNYFEQQAFLEKVFIGFEAIFTKRQNACILNGKDAPAVIAKQAYDYIIQWLYQKQNSPFL